MGLAEMRRFLPCSGLRITGPEKFYWTSLRRWVRRSLRKLPPPSPGLGSVLQRTTFSYWRFYKTFLSWSPPTNKKSEFIYLQKEESKPSSTSILWRCDGCIVFFCSTAQEGTWTGLPKWLCQGKGQCFGCLPHFLPAFKQMESATCFIAKSSPLRSWTSSQEQRLEKGDGDG